MKFVISATSIFEFETSRAIIDKYPFLNEYGFEIVDEPITKKCRIWDENGEPMYMEVPDIRRVSYVNIDTLEQLMSLCERVGCDTNELVLTCADMASVINKVMLPEIEIYDSYRE